MNYLKYYFLEDSLFSEVTTAFQGRGYLTAEEFFSIVIWKANRAKSRIKQKLLAHNKDLATIVKTLTQEIHDAPNDQERLSLFLTKWRFPLPMASAILAVLYPDRFTVYDVRAREQLEIKDFAGRKNEVDHYFTDFLPKVTGITHARTLRDKDRYLWGKSVYEDLRNFLKTT